MLARRQLTRPAARMRRSRREQAGDGLLWLFDLDNTLHDTSHAIFPKIDAGMTRAVSEMLDVDVDAANEYRTRYWKRYGATVIGMVRHHGADPHRFLHRSHDFDVKPLVRAEKGLANKLKRLPGRKVLLTNAPLHYARAVLRHLGILQQFDALWGIDQMRLHGEFRPKPSAALLRYVLAHEGVPARAARRAGRRYAGQSARRPACRTAHRACLPSWHTFRRAHRHRPGYVDLRVNCVTDLLLRRRPLRG
ncbi:haloacid dehalogenase-like hydrolase family protein [Bordetella holmesii 35009]|nr:haloacid dehalogenase-like hydrolase family protein [Bordetella holmesii 35009]